MRKIAVTLLGHEMTREIAIAALTLLGREMHARDRGGCAYSLLITKVRVV